MKRRWLLLRIHAMLVMAPHCLSTPQGYSIPGTTQTQSGYDTEHGQDAICWISRGSSMDSSNTIAFPNPLVSGFKLLDRVNLLPSCPDGNVLVAEAPVEFFNERLRTERWYDFTVTFQLNVTSLVAGQNITDYSFISDVGSQVALQIMACDLGTAGFCSPFKHEESLAKERARNESQVVKRGDRHGGSHVHSAYEFVELSQQEGPLFNATLQIPMIINPEGNYFLITALQLFFEGAERVRFDIANALPINQRVMAFQKQFERLTVAPKVRMCAYVANALVTGVIGVLLWQTVKHRNHQIMNLTQGNILIIYLVSAMVLTSSSFMLDPRSNLHCRLGGPVLLISAQLMYAVTMGRLWRINAVISPLLVQTLRQRERSGSGLFASLIAKLPKRDAQHQKSLKKTITSEQLAFRVAFLVGPQVFLQLGALTLQPARHDTKFNLDESIGQDYCARSGSTWLSFSTFGYIYFALLVLVMLVTAHQTRALPSLFNETRDIFDSTLGTVVVLILGVGIAQVANGRDGNASPAVNFVVGETLILTSTLNATIRVIMPKLRMIWRGETVLVSKLMSDHKQSVLKDNMLYMKKRATNRKNVSSTESSGHLDFMDFSSIKKGPEGAGGGSVGSIKTRRSRKQVVKESQTPGGTLVLKMFNAQNELSQVTDRIMSGAVVPEEDWMELRNTCRRLSFMFEHEVEFHWEKRRLPTADKDNDDDDDDEETNVPDDRTSFSYLATRLAHDTMNDSMSLGAFGDPILLESTSRIAPVDLENPIPCKPAVSKDVFTDVKDASPLPQDIAPKIAPTNPRRPVVAPPTTSKDVPAKPENPSPPAPTTSSEKYYFM